MWNPKPLQIVAGVITLILMKVSGGKIEAAGKKKKKKFSIQLNRLAEEKTVLFPLLTFYSCIQKS